jgi:hypothetical protein
MRLPYTLVTPLYKVDRDLLFSETKSQQGVKCETGISDPSESIIPDCQQGIKVQLYQLTNFAHLPHVQVARMLVLLQLLLSLRIPASSCPKSVTDHPSWLTGLQGQSGPVDILPPSTFVATLGDPLSPIHARSRHQIVQQSLSHHGVLGRPQSASSFQQSCQWDT